MDLKKILNTITSEKGEEILEELKSKGGGLTDLLQEKLLGNKGEQTDDQQGDAQQNPLEAMLQGKLKDFAEKAKSEIESRIKK